MRFQRPRLTRLERVLQMMQAFKQQRLSLRRYRNLMRNGMVVGEQ